MHILNIQLPFFVSATLLQLKLPAIEEMARKKKDGLNIPGGFAL